MRKKKAEEEHRNYINIVSKLNTGYLSSETSCIARYISSVLDENHEQYNLSVNENDVDYIPNTHLVVVDCLLPSPVRCRF